MSKRRVDLLILGVAALAWAPRFFLAAAGTEPDFGLSAPLLPVDRFSDAAATELRRSVHADLPAPNSPIDFDREPFLRTVADASGSSHRCYDLDRRTLPTSRFYVFYDSGGNYLLAQFPVLQTAPGRPGYSDLWHVWKVVVPAGFSEDNHVRSIAELERLLADSSAGYTASDTGIVANIAVVPEGSRAALGPGRSGKPARRGYAWFGGQRAPLLYFEESLSVSEPLIADAKQDGSGKIVIEKLPGQAGYAPLLEFGKRDSSGTALYWNCPIVGENTGATN